MKISDISGPGKTSSVKKKSNKNIVGDFGSYLSEDDTSNTVKSAGISSFTPIMNLTAIQELEGGEEEKKRQIDRGKNILDNLEDIRREMLLGNISAITAKRLADQVRSRKATFLDPALEQILKEIEVRAEVELAKIEMSKK